MMYSFAAVFEFVEAESNANDSYTEMRWTRFFFNHLAFIEYTKVRYYIFTNRRNICNTHNDSSRCMCVETAREFMRIHSVRFVC